MDTEQKPEISIFNIREVKEGRVFYFTAMVAYPGTDCAIILDDLKYFEGRLYPPQKRVGGRYYSTAAFSPGLAQLIGEKFEDVCVDLTPDDDAHLSLKWGQQVLGLMLGDEKLAQDVWAHYRRTKAGRAGLEGETHAE